MCRGSPPIGRTYNADPRHFVFRANIPNIPAAFPIHRRYLPYLLLPAIAPKCLIACAHPYSRHAQYSFAGALHASVHLRDYELAMNLLEEMVDIGMPANSQSYATAIRTCARCSKSDEAVFVYASQLRMTIVPTEVCRPLHLAG